MEASFWFGLSRERFPELFTVAEEFFHNENEHFNADLFFQDWSAQIFSLELSEQVLPTKRFSGGERGVFYINVLGQVFSSVEEVRAWHWTDHIDGTLPLTPHSVMLLHAGKTTPLTNAVNLAINLARALQDDVQISIDHVVAGGALQVSLWFPRVQQQFAVGKPMHANDNELTALQEELTRWTWWFAEPASKYKHVGIRFPNGYNLTLMYSSADETRSKLAGMTSFAPTNLSASPQFLQWMEKRYAATGEVMMLCSEAFAYQCLVQVCLCLVGKSNQAITSVPLVLHGDAKQLLIDDAMQQRVWSKFKLNVSNDAVSATKKQALPCSVCCEIMIHVTWQLCPASKAQALEIATTAANKALHHSLSRMNQARLEEHNSHALRSAASSMASILMQASPLTKQTALELCNNHNGGDLEQVIFQRLLDLQRGSGQDEDSDQDTVIFDE